MCYIYTYQLGWVYVGILLIFTWSLFNEEYQKCDQSDSKM